MTATRRTAEVAEWRQRALCAAHPDPELWDDRRYQGETDATRHARHARAIQVCRACPVAAACLAAVVRGRDDGVRGGKVLPPLRYAHGHTGAGRPPIPREHGSTRGYHQHYNRDDLPVCAPCTKAKRDHDNARIARERAARQQQQESA